jgi:hypothetical protein
MPIDMDMYDSAYEDGCNDCGDIGMPPPRLRPIYEKIGRSLDEILQLEVELINSNTEFTPEEWVSRYAERFREILSNDSTLTPFQVKWHLYLNK